MAPHRVATAQAAISASTAGTGLGAAGAAILALVTGLHGVLIIMVLVVQSADIVTGSRRAKRNAGEQFDREFQQQGIANKLTRDVQILIAMTYDLGAQLLAGVAGRGEDVAAMGVFTAALLGWMLYSEGTSALENIRATEGKSSVWIGFKQMQRRMDIQAFGGPEDLPPLRRQSDLALVEMEALPPEDRAPPITQREP